MKFYPETKKELNFLQYKIKKYLNGKKVHEFTKKPGLIRSFPCEYRGIDFNINLCLLIDTTVVTDEVNVDHISITALKCGVIATPIHINNKAISTFGLSRLAFDPNIESVNAFNIIVYDGKCESHPHDEKNLDIHYGIRLAVHRSYRNITGAIKHELDKRWTSLCNDITEEGNNFLKKSKWITKRWEVPLQRISEKDIENLKKTQLKGDK